MVDLGLKKVEQLLANLTRSQVQGNPVADPVQPLRLECVSIANALVFCHLAISHFWVQD